MPATAAGTQALRSFTVFSATSRALACSGEFLAGDDHVRLEDGSLEPDVGERQLLEHHLQRPLGHGVARVDVVGGDLAVHKHLGLDDRDDPRLLAEEVADQEQWAMSLLLFFFAGAQAMFFFVVLRSSSVCACTHLRYVSRMRSESL